ncbi:MAG: hypothetical protein JWN61_1060 [Pseudonocardiales bacterium]|nr:hypothetical protein [Jatrophihabitantaceae bacterium]MCW2602925.1 hypothetical protein [Pseudonocardiales bacterium]
MITVQREIRTPRPMADVVAYLSDFSNAEQWDPGTVSCARLGSGPIAVGTTYRNVSRFRGKETQLQYELTRLDPDHLVFVGNNKTVTSTDDLAFAPDRAGGTVLTYRATLVFHGLAKLATPFLRRPFEKLADETQAQMTRVLAALRVE